MLPEVILHLTMGGCTGTGKSGDRVRLCSLWFGLEAEKRGRQDLDRSGEEAAQWRHTHHPGSRTDSCGPGAALRPQGILSVL